jgi:tetratricopeptide (TPR) repeat protein
MAENSRIDDLRRRVQKDPASIAFAQLAEECRRSGAHQEAVDTCRAGLAIHPAYLSAHVTLGRALVELGQLDEAQAELSLVLESAPENLAAIRGLAEIYHRRGDLSAALAQYRAALLLARNDPDLEETIADLSRQIEPSKPAPTGGLTLAHMQDELLKHAPPPKASKKEDSAQTGGFGGQAWAEKTPVPISAEHETQADNPAKAGFHDGAGSHDGLRLDPAANVVPPADGTLAAAADDHAARTVAALEQWLAAIHVSRDQRNS